MPGVATPALSLPYPTVDTAPSAGKTIVVFGGSSSAGSMTTQIANAAGIHVIAVAGAHNFDLCRESGAAEVFDHKDTSIVDKVVEAVRQSGNDFVGIFDAIAIQDTFDINVDILTQLGGGHLALSHPPVGAVPENIKAGMIFAVNEIATPVWKNFVTPALRSGKLKCLPPPTVVGKGLQYIQEGLEMSKAGVSGTKLVVEL
jgi:NADPH:quinone reductase-like Zn-dependent oxidoreductase